MEKVKKFMCPLKKKPFLGKPDPEAAVLRALVVSRPPPHQLVIHSLGTSEFLGVLLRPPGQELIMNDNQKENSVGPVGRLVVFPARITHYKLLVFEPWLKRKEADAF